jgi:hypothetical protein
MRKEPVTRKVRFLGLDVHADTIALVYIDYLSVAEGEGFVPEAARAAACLKPTPSGQLSNAKLAEGEGFEPPEPLPVQWFSRPPPSTTRPSLRIEISPESTGSRINPKPFHAGSVTIGATRIGEPSAIVVVIVQPGTALSLLRGSAGVRRVGGFRRRERFQSYERARGAIWRQGRQGTDVQPPGKAASGAC